MRSDWPEVASSPMSPDVRATRSQSGLVEVGDERRARAVGFDRESLEPLPDHCAQAPRSKSCSGEGARWPPSILVAGSD